MTYSTKSVLVFSLLFAVCGLGAIGTNALAAEKKAANDPNKFNRLMKPASKRNPPLAKDGIHDPENQGLQVLQQPKTALQVLEKGKSGNYVDWVKSLEKGKINPLYDLKDRDAKAMPLDLNIVREVKGSMPDVIYPHRQHTEWLDCSNCHPDIFIPQKGANQISMAEIMLGKKCGVCHGKVAFPISECRRCHSAKSKANKTSKKK